MISKEEQVRADIATKFGSIPKMAKAIDLPQNTIYHALDRGLDNTTSKTRSAILEALYGKTEHQAASIWTDDEHELIELFRTLNVKAQHALLVGLREYVS